MKTLLPIILLAGSFYFVKAQNPSLRQDSSKKIYTDSAKRGKEIYNGSTRKNKSDGDTLKGSKTRSGSKQKSTLKKQGSSSLRPNKRVTLAFNDFKV